MSDIDTSQPETGSEFREKFEDALEENANLKGESESKDRTIAFLRAGIDPESDEGQVIAAQIDGEITPESITAARERLSQVFGGPASEPSEDPTTTAQGTAQPESQDVDRDRMLETAAARNELTGQGGKLPDPPQRDAVDEGYERYQDLRRQGRTEEDARKAVIGGLFDDVANRGAASPRAWNGWDHLEQTRGT